MEAALKALVMGFDHVCLFKLTTSGPPISVILEKVLDKRERSGILCLVVMHRHLGWELHVVGVWVIPLSKMDAPRLFALFPL